MNNGIFQSGMDAYAVSSNDSLCLTKNNTTFIWMTKKIWIELEP
jgi:hypothetical protein